MTADLRLQVICRYVAELAAFEGDVAGRLERAQQLSSGHPDILAAIQRLRPMVQTHRDQLATYLKDFGGAEPNEKMANLQSASREARVMDANRNEMTRTRCASSCDGCRGPDDDSTCLALWRRAPPPVPVDPPGEDQCVATTKL